MNIADFSVYVNTWGYPPPTVDEFVEVAQLAEDLGFHSIGFPHVPVALPADEWPESRHIMQSASLRHYHLDPIALVPMILSETKRIKVGFQVLTVANAHPFHWAKYLASLDQLSGGRVVAGFGLGAAHPAGAKDASVASLERLGLSSRVRGKMANESMEIMTRLWSSDEPVTFEGEFWQAINVEFAPKSARRPWPELWWAGESGPAIRRSASFNCDYHQVVWPSAQKVAEVWAPQLAAARERYESRTRLAVLIFGEVLPYDPEPDELQRRYHCGATPEAQASGTPQRCADVIHRLADAGVDHFAMDFHRHGGDPLPRSLGQMQAWAEEVMPLLA